MSAFHPQSASEADQVAGRSDVLCGHYIPIDRGEQEVNIRSVELA
jgi:hypothetical protein